MGQVPAKYFLPSAPYGASPAANTLNPVQSAAVNPQTPLLSSNFYDPGTMSQPQGVTSSGSATSSPLSNPGANQNQTALKRALGMML